MAIIYSYPNNINVLATDVLICTSTAIVNGKKKNVTRSIDIGSLGTFVNLGNTLNSVLTNGNTSLLSMSVGSVAIDGGLSSEFLKADGSTDSSVYALDADVVHLAGNETIAGIKTFTDNVKIIGDQKYLSISSADNETGNVTIATDINGLPYVRIGKSASEDTATFRIDNINTNSVYQLPNQSGTMALIEDLAPYALDANVVHLAGDETIDGIKTFIKDANINGLTIGKGSGDVYNNTAIGDSALYSNTTGQHNTANGNGALYSNTTGQSNTSNGYYALSSNTTGDANTANGFGALYNNTSGSQNMASGHTALYNNTTGADNTANGYEALYFNTTGNNNTANGANALQHNTTGNQNVANGVSALYSNTTGNYNSANGYHSLYSNTAGSSNEANGIGTLFSNTVGSYNAANGANSLYLNTTGSNNVANGYRALYSNTIGPNNTANGYYALYNNTAGGSNTANGHSSLYSNTTGVLNAANGHSALYSNTTGNQNTANGNSALYNNTTASYNSANGYRCLFGNVTGTHNTANGYEALRNNTTGSSNVANGTNALYSNTTGSYNTANGQVALYFNTAGNNNVAYGYQAGNTVFGGTQNTNPSNSVFIGMGTKSKTNADTNQTVIGFNAVGDGSNTARIGNTSTTALYVGGNGAGIVLKATNGTPYKITVSSTGVITATAI